MSQLTLADLEIQAHRLLSNHTAIKVLDALGHGGDLRDPDLATEHESIADALKLLDQMGLVDPGPPSGAPPDQRSVALTPRGRSVAEFLAGIVHPQK
jgi:hypothetical protein